MNKNKNRITNERITFYAHQPYVTCAELGDLAGYGYNKTLKLRSEFLDYWYEKNNGESVHINSMHFPTKLVFEFLDLDFDFYYSIGGTQ